MFYIVSTPIGNLKDITLRAIEVLKNVKLVFAEDARTAKILFTHYQINTPLSSYHTYNRIKKTEYALKLLREGKDIALISEAGTPGISDPGLYLIRKVIEEGITLQAIPGPTALISALVISGFPTHRFVFEGFLPKRKGARKKRLTSLAKEERTIILYESPHRLLKLLEEIKEFLGERKVCCVREMTKKFEEIKRANVSELITYFKHNTPRGEFVLIL